MPCAAQDQQIVLGSRNKKGMHFLVCIPSQIVIILLSQIKKSSRFLPPIQSGALPRPDQVVPVAGSRYFAATTFFSFKQFYNDEAFWPEGHWHEDEEIIIEFDGVIAHNDGDYDLLSMPNNAKVTISYGIVQDEEGNEFGTLEAYFRKWRKKKNTAHLVVSVPLDKLDAVKAAISAAGGKVVS